MEYVDVNWVAVVLAAVSSIIIGSIWYSPAVFGNMWMEQTGIRPEDMKDASKAYAGGTVNSLLIAFVLAIFLHHLGVETVGDGACVGFWAWLGFSLTGQFSGVLWEQKPLKLFLINSGCMLVILPVMGAIIAFWK